MNKQRYIAVRKANFVSGGVNLFQAIAKTVVGAFGGSSALLADGIHSFSDLLANILVWITNKIGHTEPDEEHPYGHGRFETIGTLALGLFLMAVAAGLAWDAVSHIINHEIVKPSILALVVALLSIALNESVFRYSIIIAKRVDSSLLRANAYHNRADSLSALIVVVGILGELAGFTFADAIATVLVAGFVVKIGIELTWRAVEELTDRGLPSDKIKAFEEIILNVSGVRQMHQLRTRTMGDRIFLDVHILIAAYASASEGHYIAETVHYYLKKKFNGIQDITIHVDTEDHPESVPERLMPNRREIEKVLLSYLQTELQQVEQKEVLDLFYFRNHVEVQVILPLAALEKHSSEVWKEKLTALLKQIPDIHSVNLRFGLI